MLQHKILINQSKQYPRSVVIHIRKLGLSVCSSVACIDTVSTLDTESSLLAAVHTPMAAHKDIEHNIVDAEETVDAVLQEVVDDVQHWTAHKAQDVQDIAGYAEGTLQHPQPRLTGQLSASFDQALRYQVGTAKVLPTNVSVVAATAAALSHLPPVVSAINPLFQPAQPVRPLQQTLSSMTSQLSALEDSMQQPAQAGTLSEHATVQPRAETSGKSSQRPGESAPSCVCSTAETLLHGQLHPKEICFGRHLLFIRGL